MTRRARCERGALMPMVGLLLVVLIPSSAIAVDLGMQRVVRRDMQTLSDVVALDLVRLVDGRTASQILAGYNGQPTLDNALARSVARNDDVLGVPPTVTATLAHLDTATGQLDTVSGGATREVTGTEVPNAVEVTAAGAVEFAFMPGRGTALRTAVAIAAPSACFRLGSFAVGVNTDDSNLLNTLLPGLLDNPTFSGTLIGYQGLAAANLTLLDLVGVSSLGVGTPDELLRLDGLTLGEFYAALASALQARGGHVAEVTLLQTLSTKANLTSTIAIADLLDIGTGDTAALAASFNVLDLVVGAVYAANGTNALAVPQMTTLVPGLANLTTSLTVVEKPKLACGAKGKAKASTGQVELELAGDVGVPAQPVAPGLLLSGSLNAQARVNLEVLLARATGTLSNIICGDATTTSNAEGIDVDVTASLLSTVSASQAIRVQGHLELKQALPFVGTIKVADVVVDLSGSSSTSTAQSTTGTTVSFRHPDDGYGTPKSYGSGIALSPIGTPTISPTATVQVTYVAGPLSGSVVNANVATLPGLQALVGSLLGSTTSAVNASVVTPLNTLVTPQLAKQLGIRVGGADVFALPRPSCSDPQLAG